MRNFSNEQLRWEHLEKKEEFQVAILAMKSKIKGNLVISLV